MADAVPVNRLPHGGTWAGIVGVREVNPATRTRYVGPLPTSTSVATINSHLAACPSGQYVELAAGTFNLQRRPDDFHERQDAARGGGRQRTAGDHPQLLRGSNVEHCGEQLGLRVIRRGAFTTIGVSGGATRGSSTLTLSSTPSGLTAGRLMWISAPKNAPTIDGGGWTDWFGTRPFTQVVKVTAVSGNNVSFFPAINADYLGGLRCRCTIAALPIRSASRAWRI